MACNATATSIAGRKGRWRRPMAGRLTTHVLDTASGKPAAGLTIVLYRVQRQLAPQGQGRPSPTPTAAATRRCSRATAFQTGAVRADLLRRRLSADDQGRAARSAVPRPDADPLRHGRGDALPRAAARLALRLFDLPGKLSMASRRSAPNCASSSTARTSRSPTSRRTRRCSTICGCAARCAAPRKAAPRAIAAPAPCWSAG